MQPKMVFDFARGKAMLKSAALSAEVIRGRFRSACSLYPLASS